MSFQSAKVHKKLETRKINFVDSGKISIFAIGNPSYIPMLQDIFDKDGKVIAQVETVRMETKYSDGRGITLSKYGTTFASRISKGLTFKMPISGI